MVTMSDVQSSSLGGPIQLAITNGGSRPSDKWGGGRGGGGSTRPRGKGGGVHPDPEIRGDPV